MRSANSLQAFYCDVQEIANELSYLPLGTSQDSHPYRAGFTLGYIIAFDGLMPSHITRLQCHYLV